ncbi:DUF87 domain-containing protein [Saprospiraceae bacterium]|nr:DUF87 domain-containing protein [Saprospiraceae bacterium]
MATSFDFSEYLEYAFAKFGIEEGTRDSFEGTLSLKSNDTLADFIIKEYILSLRQEQPEPPATENQGCLGFLFGNQSQEEPAPPVDITPYERFLTRTEFETIFKENVGLTLDTEQARAEKKMNSFLKNTEESEEDYEEAERVYDNIIEAFYRLYPAYALFNITDELERRSLVQALTSDDGETGEAYYYAMEASNPEMADFFLKQRRIKISEKERRKHTILLASTGSGKSELLKTFIRQHNNFGKTAIVVFDPKADFAKEIAMFRENAWASRRDKLVYIDPELSTEKVPVINPFDVDVKGLTSDEVDKIAQEIFESIKEVFKEKNHDATTNMEMILLPIVHTLVRKKDGCLADIYRFLNDKDNADLIELGKSSPNEAISYFFNHRWSEYTLTPSKEGLEKRIFNILTIGAFGKLTTGKTSIDLRKAIDEKKLIIFNLSKGKLTKDLAIVYGKFLLITLANIMFSRAKLSKNKRTPCHIYIDEFHNYSSYALEELFTEGRGLGAFMTVASQTVGQNLKEEARRKIMDNCNVKVVGKSGKDTRKEMQSQMDIDTDTAKVSGVDKKVLSNLKVGEFVVKVGSNLPFKAKNRTHTLDNRNSMRKEHWEQIINEQLERYYVKPTPLNLKKPQEKDNSSPTPPPREKQVDEERNSPKKDKGNRRSFNPKFDA